MTTEYTDPRAKYLRRNRSGLYGEPAVPWLSIRQLQHTAKEVALASVFARFADQRETMTAIVADLLALTSDHHDDHVRVDYAADTGDGFDATLAVARLLVRGDEIGAAGTHSGPPDLLILGGDQVYPVASAENYRSRFDRVFETAWHIQGLGGHRPPPVLALPGNHDWYDGLVSFRRLFCQSWAALDVTRDTTGLVPIGDHEPPDVTVARNRAGGWATVQSRSYFAVRVHPKWWIWGVDSQLNAPIDAAQTDYFRGAAERLGPDDGLVVCTATPCWLAAAGNSPPDFRDVETPLATLSQFLHTILGLADPRLRLLLTGDKHHYAHYQPAEEQPGSDDQLAWVAGPELITCGGGGAFTASTHHLAADLSVPWGQLPPPATPGHDTAPALGDRRVATRYKKRTTYPSVFESKAMRAHIWFVGWRNGVVFPALVAALLLWVFAVTVEQFHHPGPVARWVPMAVLLLALGAFAATGVRAATHIPLWKRVCQVGLATVGHFCAYLIVLWVADLVEDVVLGRAWSSIAVVLVFLLLGPLVFAAYLWTCDLFGFHELESFSSFGSTQYKSLLRMTFSADAVDIAVVGMPTVPPARSAKVKVGPEDPPLTCVAVDSMTINRRPGPVPQNPDSFAAE